MSLVIGRKDDVEELRTIAGDELIPQFATDDEIELFGDDVLAEEIDDEHKDCDCTGSERCPMCGEDDYDEDDYDYDGPPDSGDTRWVRADDDADCTENIVSRDTRRQTLGDWWWAEMCGLTPAEDAAKASAAAASTAASAAAYEAAAVPINDGDDISMEDVLGIGAKAGGSKQ